jgi:hypothetical protein
MGYNYSEISQTPQICYTIGWEPTNQLTLNAEVILQKKTKETVGDGLFNDLDYDDRLSWEN